MLLGEYEQKPSASRPSGKLETEGNWGAGFEGGRRRTQNSQTCSHPAPQLESLMQETQAEE